MNEFLEQAVGALGERFSAQGREFRGDVSVVVAAGQIAAACQALRDEYHFELLSDITAVDYWPEQTPRFCVVYALRSLKHNQILFLRAPLEGNAPALPTVEGVYPSANWFEREIFDLFGIRFERHSDLRRILMPHDWAGHPLRKDYPVGYEEVQFSFNYKEIDLRKPYALE